LARLKITQTPRLSEPKAEGRLNEGRTFRPSTSHKIHRTCKKRKSGKLRGRLKILALIPKSHCPRGVHGNGTLLLGGAKSTDLKHNKLTLMIVK
jgi:hypothetical protein